MLRFMIKRRALIRTRRTGDDLREHKIMQPFESQRSDSPTGLDMCYHVHSGTNPEERGTRVLPVVSTHGCTRAGRNRSGRTWLIMGCCVLRCIIICDMVGWGLIRLSVDGFYVRKIQISFRDVTSLMISKNTRISVCSTPILITLFI